MIVTPATIVSHVDVCQLEPALDAEDQDDHLEDGEHAGLDHRDGVQQRADRRRRHHGRRQPEMHAA